MIGKFVVESGACRQPKQSKREEMLDRVGTTGQLLTNVTGSQRMNL